MKRALTLLLTLLLTSAWAQELEIHFVDVGQGDAVLVRTPEGQNVLYDGGRSSTTVLEYLQGLGVPSLDIVIASHPDADHIGGLAEVLRAYRPRFFMQSPVPADSQTYVTLQDAFNETVEEEIEPTNRRLALGQTTLQVLPPPGDPALGRNDNSVGIVVSYGAFRAALTGDAEEAQMSWWLEHVPELLEPVQVYKSSHHGSLNGDSVESMTAFGPETVVISVGANNSFGHPAPEILALYESVNATVYRTDLQGTIVDPRN